MLREKTPDIVDAGRLDLHLGLGALADNDRPNIYQIARRTEKSLATPIDELSGLVVQFNDHHHVRPVRVRHPDSASFSGFLPA